MNDSKIAAMTRRGTGAAALVAAFGLAGCGALPGGIGQPIDPLAIETATSMTAQERQEGAKAHPQLLQEFGGTYQGPQAAYVSRVGQTIAVQSGLSNARQDFTVSLLDSPVNNAFAISGGYVYVTRNLVALMNDEAELAGVLGHEVGHIAGRHSAERQSAAQRSGLFGLLTTVIGGAIGGVADSFGRLLAQGSGLYTLRFSRNQELEADALGVRYLAGAGYDPSALSTMLTSLALQTDLEARAQGRDARSLPEWASTHPDPGARVANARELATRVGAVGGNRNEQAFKAAIDGMLYGDSPAQGIIEGNEFRHPELRLAFRVPQGFAMQNGSSAVSISGNGGQGQFTMAPYAGNLEAYVGQALRTIAGNQQVTATPVRRTTVNGIPAAFTTARATTQQGQVDVTIFAYEFASNRAYHFVTLTPAGRSAAFEPMFGSVRRLTTTEAAAIKPRRIDVVTVRAGDTVQSLASRMAYDTLRLERFLVLNRLSSGTTLRPGQTVKIVTY